MQRRTQPEDVKPRLSAPPNPVSVSTTIGGAVKTRHTPIINRRRAQPQLAPPPSTPSAPLPDLPQSNQKRQHQPHPHGGSAQSKFRIKTERRPMQVAFTGPQTGPQRASAASNSSFGRRTNDSSSTSPNSDVKPVKSEKAAVEGQAVKPDAVNQLTVKDSTGQMVKASDIDAPGGFAVPANAVDASIDDDSFLASEAKFDNGDLFQYRPLSLPYRTQAFHKNALQVKAVDHAMPEEDDESIQKQPKIEQVQVKHDLCLGMRSDEEDDDQPTINRSKYESVYPPSSLARLLQQLDAIERHSEDQSSTDLLFVQMPTHLPLRPNVKRVQVKSETATKSSAKKVDDQVIDLAGDAHPSTLSADERHYRHVMASNRFVFHSKSSSALNIPSNTMSAVMDDDDGKQQQQNQQQQQMQSEYNQSVKSEPSSQTPAADTSLKGARLGTLILRRSGRVQMRCGDLMYELQAGTRFKHHAQAVSVKLPPSTPDEQQQQQQSNQMHDEQQSDSQSINRGSCFDLGSILQHVVCSLDVNDWARKQQQAEADDVAASSESRTQSVSHSHAAASTSNSNRSRVPIASH